MAPKLSPKQWVLSLPACLVGMPVRVILAGHLILSMLLALSLYQFFEITDHQTKLSFLDVGQGDSILLQTPEYKNILIDGGPDGKVIEELSKKLDFFNQKIDLLILTHPHLDHYGGMLDVVQKYPIGAVMLTGVAGDRVYGSFIKQLKEKEIPIWYPDSSKDLQVGRDLILDILYPFKSQSLIGQDVKNKNNSSVSLMIRDKSGKAEALLTGDAEMAQEIELLLSGQDFASPLEKLGHHGSRTSSTLPFLNAVNAKTVVISAGKNNKFGHPHKETLEKVKDKEVHITANEGTIDFSL